MPYTNMPNNEKEKWYKRLCVRLGCFLCKSNTEDDTKTIDPEDVEIGPVDETEPEEPEPEIVVPAEPPQNLNRTPKVKLMGRVVIRDNNETVE